MKCLQDQLLWSTSFMWELCVYRCNGICTAITFAILTAIKILFQNIPNLNFSQLCQLYVSLCSVQVQNLCKHLRASGINKMWEPSGWSVFSWYAWCAYQVDCTCASRCKAAQKRTAVQIQQQKEQWTLTCHRTWTDKWQLDTSQVFLPSERSALTKFYKPLSLAFDSVDIQNGCCKIWTFNLKNTF